MSSGQPKIAAVICTYNRYDVLPKAIESVRRQDLPADDFRIMVIDNSPDHARADLFGKRYIAVSNVAYIIEKKAGLSNARNVAACLCDTDLIVYLDDDAIAGPDWLDNIIAAFDRFGPTAQIVGGRVNPIWGAPRPPWLHESMLGNLSVVDWGGGLRIAGDGEWFAGANIAFRTSAILENDGFATNLGRIGSGASLLSNEEFHLVERIRAIGGQMIYAPDASVEHLVEPARLKRAWFRKRSAWQAVSDFTMAPDRMLAEAPQYWEKVTDYFNELPPHQRTIRGLLIDTDDPELFRWQLGVVYMLTVLQLAGFDGVSLE